MVSLRSQLDTSKSLDKVYHSAILAALDRVLRPGFETSGNSVVERDKWAGPHEKTIQNLQMGGHGVDGGLHVLWKCRWFCGVSPAVHRLAAARSGSWAMVVSLQNWEKPSFGVVIVVTQVRCTSCFGGPTAPGKLVGWSLLVASIGNE